MKKDIEKHWHYLQKQPFEVAWEVLGPVISRNIPFPPKDKNADYTYMPKKYNDYKAMWQVRANNEKRKKKNKVLALDIVKLAQGIIRHNKEHKYDNKEKALE